MKPICVWALENRVLKDSSPEILKEQDMEHIISTDAQEYRNLQTNICAFSLNMFY